MKIVFSGDFMMFTVKAPNFCIVRKSFLQTEETIEADIYECLTEKREFSEKNWCIENNIIELNKD